MTPYELLRKAAEMEVDKDYAIGCRKRYLLELAESIGQLVGKEWYADYQLREIQDEIRALNRLAQQNAADDVSEDEVAEAKRRPITDLIEFGRDGKARGMCPNDSSHSLDLWKRGNVARCFPCDQSWGPLAWATKVMGMKFKEAVNYLRR